MTATEFGTHIKAMRKSGQEFTGKCPAHEDQRASLSWRDGDKGLVVKCFAGCTVDAVTAAIGLKPSALFATNGKLPLAPPSQRRAIAHYPYTDEAGTLLYEVVRFEPKGFSQRQPDGKGGWTWSLNNPPVRRVLYRLPSLKGQAEVYYVEGERDADSLASLGIAATTSPGGAGKWNDDWTAQLQAAGVNQVVILPDNDAPGEAHALQVAAACLEAKMKVKVIRLDGLPEKGDVSDWLEAGHAADELRGIVRGWPLEKKPKGGVTSFAEAVYAEINDLEAAPPEFISTPFPGLNWLLCGGLVPGELYYLAAKGGEGKSALSLELARYVAQTWGVLIVSQEMGVPAVSRRLLAQESRVSARRMRQRTLEPTDWGPLTAAAGALSIRKGWIVSQAPTLEAMTAALAQTTGVRLVIVDYLQLLSAKGQDSRSQLEAVSRGLKALALAHHVAVFCLSAVTTRGEGKQKPSMHWLRGSGMLEHDCDVALLLHQPDPASSDRELIVAKARDAECGSIRLTFSPEILHFVETELHRQEPTDQWERA
jgi:hypothetical protein